MDCPVDLEHEGPYCKEPTESGCSGVRVRPAVTRMLVNGEPDTALHFRIDVVTSCLARRKFRMEIEQHVEVPEPCASASFFRYACFNYSGELTWHDSHSVEGCPTDHPFECGDAYKLFSNPLLVLHKTCQTFSSRLFNGLHDPLLCHESVKAH